MFCSLWLPGSGLAVQAVPSSDAFVQQSSSSNFGDKKELRVGDSGKYQSLVKLDLSGLPASVMPEDVGKATLKLFLTKVNKAGSFDVLAVEDDWNEKTVTWANRPGTFVDPLATIAVTKSDALSYVLVDLTALVKIWMEFPSENYGIALVPVDSAIDVQFEAKESQDTSHDPRLEIVVTSAGEDGTDGVDGMDGMDGADGCSVLNGEGPPDAADGKDCDFHLDTSTSELYGPKTGGEWGDPVSLEGEDGAPGQDGQDGAPGQDGEDGAPGQDGQDGAPGQDGQDGQDGVSGWERKLGDAGNFGGGKHQAGSATCSVGKKVLGGGVQVTGSNLALVAEKVHVSSSYPSADNVWSVRLWSSDQTTGYTFQVFAICATVD
ncbi:MAG TPA: DNRLRE domain-containing protein [Thermoanaerobaculia bacterium]|nr:DNRLRE domain-containing protein [Thermoanaerobaculia bacterium]